MATANRFVKHRFSLEKQVACGEGGRIHRAPSKYTWNDTVSHYFQWHGPIEAYKKRNEFLMGPGTMCQPNRNKMACTRCEAAAKWAQAVPRHQLRSIIIARDETYSRKLKIRRSILYCAKVSWNPLQALGAVNLPQPKSYTPRAGKGRTKRRSSPSSRSVVQTSLSWVHTPRVHKCTKSCKSFNDVA